MKRKVTRTKRSILNRPKEELHRLNLGEKTKRGLSPKGAYYVPKGTKVTKQTAYVTVSSWRDFQLGFSHTKAAKLRKEKRLGYGPHGLSEVAPQSVRTRERLTEPQYDKPWQHAYLNARITMRLLTTFSGGRVYAICRIIRMLGKMLWRREME